MERLEKIAVLVFVMCLIVFGLIIACHADSASSGNDILYVSVIYNEKAILAIIGEAENQGYDGMLAVACAIRNRDTLRGVFGANSPRVKNHKFTKGIYVQAKMAWEKSLELIDLERGYAAIKMEFKKGKFHPVTHHWRINGYDPSGGANSWENVNDYGKPYWADKCQQTVIVKDHIFYKCPGYGNSKED